MSTVMLKNQSYATYVELEHKNQSRQQPGRLQQRLQRLVFDWLTSRSSLQAQWQNFRTISAGQSVPYRAWSRHGAFLEMNGHSRKH